MFEVTCDHTTAKTAKQYATQNERPKGNACQPVQCGTSRAQKHIESDWPISASAEEPMMQETMQSVQAVLYSWDLLPMDVIHAFPVLEGYHCISMNEYDAEEKLFLCTAATLDPEETASFTLTPAERDRLSMVLLNTPSVLVQPVDALRRGVPAMARSVGSVRQIRPAQSDAALRQTSAVRSSFQSELSLREDRLRPSFVPVEAPRPKPILSSNLNGVPSPFFSQIKVVPKIQSPIGFDTSGDAGADLEDLDGGLYVLPLSWTFFGVPYEEDAEGVCSGHQLWKTGKKIAQLDGFLIRCAQIIEDGGDPVAVCDDEAPDLQFLLRTLTGEGAPMNEETGDPMQDILYIRDFMVEEGLRAKGLGSRILQKLPYVARRLTNLTPEMISYYLAPAYDPQVGNAAVGTTLVRFFRRNGFSKLPNSPLFYAQTGL